MCIDRRRSTQLCPYQVDWFFNGTSTPMGRDLSAHRNRYGSTNRSLINHVLSFSRLRIASRFTFGIYMARYKLYLFTYLYFKCTHDLKTIKFWRLLRVYEEVSN